MYEIVYKNERFIVKNDDSTKAEFRVVVNMDGRFNKLFVVRAKGVWAVKGLLNTYGTYTSFDDAVFVACEEVLLMQGCINKSMDEVVQERKDKIIDNIKELLAQL